MEKNVGGMERNARLGVGAILLILGVVGIAPGMGILQIVSLLAGVILLGTGLTQFCPINLAVGRNSYKGGPS